MASDPRDLPAEYFFYHYSSDQRVVTCIRCGAQSAAASAGDLATARVQPLWGGFPVRGTRQAMENWASAHELRCPKRSQAQLDALRRTEPAYVPVRVAPEHAVWVTPGRHQGQTVEVSYSTGIPAGKDVNYEAGSGDPWMRVLDHSDNTVTYYALREPGTFR